jgi:hypothetical protein
MPALRPAPRPSSRSSHLRLVAPPTDVGSWVEVRISWEGTPLEVAHLREQGSFVIAERLAKGERGFVAAPRRGEPSRSPIVVPLDEGMAAVVDDPHAVLFDRDRVLHGARREAALVRRGAQNLFPLTPERRCRFTAHGLLVELEVVAPEYAPREQKRMPRVVWAFLALVVALHVVVLGMILRIPPASAAHAETSRAP